ncbi:NF-X1-type zinc finger protein NFXL1-like [Apus apus]|uniref:NF-X1-type zinc finger protein NFXL1-like n=1 Tax=Apus apus TaxID=8895 RepID=UPI0021F8C108|nr:NF-X1-type zinc finger protein NFXL1-like [Apus apus]
MPGECTLLLALLALLVELPPTVAHQHRTGNHGAGPTGTPAPRRAPRGRWPPATLPAPSKTENPGYCPRTGSAVGASCRTGCHNDTACGPGEKCCSRGCCARCLHVEPAKPGLCPRRPARRSAAVCPNRCADDRDCAEDRKCCFSGCGLACLPPDTGSRHATAKPGVCPVVLRGSLGPCLELCDTDGDCPGTAKCCTTGCGRVCKPPTEGKATSALPHPSLSLHVPAGPGLCPLAADGDGAAECHLLCLQDQDCPPSQKCCLQGCSRMCIPPLWGQLQKPGRCPRDFTRCLHLQPPLCTNDSSCPSWHKCCLRDCRRRCTPPSRRGALHARPAPPSHGSQGRHGTRGGVWQGRISRCCPGMPLAQPLNVAEKPGVCPVVAPEGLFAPCSFPCLEDKDCLGAQKCCPLGCGPACLEPVQEQPKPGECPVAQPGLAGPCREWCRRDGDCPDAQKCCNSSCGRQCMPAAPAGTPTAAPAWQEGTRCWNDGDCGNGETCCGGRCAGLCLAEHQGKAGFCPARAGLFPSYDCRARCWHDAECPREEKCCLRGCDYVCLPPAPEKPGICPLAEELPAAAAPCGPACAGDEQCPTAEKCCRTRCGRVCIAPEPDKPGECPKVRPRQTPEPCTEQDACAHDRDCPRQEKCCFSGCAMRCARPAREHPGECPRAEPCWDPRRRRGSRCLDDSVCRQEEKCCDTGCGWDCVAVPRESRDGAGSRCVEECVADAECPRGQRCTSTGCGRVCMDIPGGRVGVCPVPREGGTCLDLCSFDEECPWGHKCCSNGCGHVCTPASLQEHEAAVVPQYRAEPCVEECEADSQCPWGQRCTRTSCGHTCTSTPGARERACPIPRDHGICLDLCSLDEDCPWGHKCCSNGCGHVCTRLPGDVA